MEGRKYLVVFNFVLQYIYKLESHIEKAFKMFNIQYHPSKLYADEFYRIYTNRMYLLGNALKVKLSIASKL